MRIVRGELPVTGACSYDTPTVTPTEVDGSGHAGTLPLPNLLSQIGHHLQHFLALFALQMYVHVHLARRNRDHGTQRFKATGTRVTCFHSFYSISPYRFEYR